MLKIKGMKKSFNIGTENETNIFQDFDLDINECETTVILGANGCGKSTLFNMVSGVLSCDTGEISLNEINLGKLKEHQRAAHIGRVHQNPSLGVSPSLTILENMSLADKKCTKFGFRKLVKKDRIQKYTDVLKTLDLGLENKLNTQVKFLSGGQRQSLSLLMATMKRPDLLLLDEHTAALDPKTSKVVMEKTMELVKKENITTLMISHNLRDAIKYSDRIIMLDKGKVILDTRSNLISETELIKIYNRQNLVDSDEEFEHAV
ncbi:ABC transporter ATP-binding protein [Proteocatella sphenisci]|uniref:ABC transporter ATP-binding protein n=1 Tax=Proteocatella sphenisci TaxID=181070 RepID=UPI000490E821|nr:ATP-binding cassette domain-containing protein [Proteocatella sphenisci]